MTDVLTPRDRTTIRAALLARLAAPWTVTGETLDTREGSDAQMETTALSVLLAGLEAQAADGPRELLPDQAVSTWLDAHGQVIELPRAAGESDSDYRARILERWQERLQGGSPREWVTACEEVTAVADAYAYARLQPGSAVTFADGCTTLVARGPAQGDSATNTRVLGGADLLDVEYYLNGTQDADGNATSGTSVRPVTTLTGNVSVKPTTEETVNVEVALLNAPTHPFPWTGSHAIVSASVTKVIISGDYRTTVGVSPFLGNLGTANYRGGYRYIIPTSTTYDGGLNQTSVNFAAVAAAPSGTIYPAPPNFDAIRSRVLDLFDTLGPGDTATPSRYPSPAEIGPPTLYLAALYDAIGNADGVVAVTPTAPLVDTTPAPRATLTLGTFLVTQ